MPYVVITEQADRNLDDYRKVMDVLGGDIGEGHLFHAVGETDAGGLRVVDVWESQASAEKFQAEKLFPAFVQVFGNPQPPSRLETFETVVFETGS